MSETTDDNWTNIEALLKLFYPQYFDPESPDYVDPAILAALYEISMEAIPWCLRDKLQNLAQALYMAYLISVRNETSTGETVAVTAGPITSEKEGDIAVTYGSSKDTGGGSTVSQRPPSDPWDAWHRLYQRCAKGAIITRYGDPAKSVTTITTNCYERAYMVWYPLRVVGL